jgi:hypothetical protein
MKPLVNILLYYFNFIFDNSLFIKSSKFLKVFLLIKQALIKNKYFINTYKAVPYLHTQFAEIKDFNQTYL